MHRHRGVGLLARVPEDVPVAGVHGGATQLGRVLRECDGVAALVGAATDLGGGELGIPQGNQRERNEPPDAGAAAPLVDDPVVVDLQTREGEFLVVALEEALPAESGEDVRVVDGRLDVVEVHVLEACGLVVGARAEVLVGGGHVALFFARDAGGAVQQAGGDLGVLEQPDVAELAVVGAAGEAVVAALELEADLVLETRGPRSRMLGGSCACQRSLGSMT